MILKVSLWLPQHGIQICGLCILNTCNSRVIVTLNNRDQARRILENNVIETYLLWGNC